MFQDTFDTNASFSMQGGFCSCKDGAILPSGTSDCSDVPIDCSYGIASECMPFAKLDLCQQWEVKLLPNQIWMNVCQWEYDGKLFI